MTAFIMASAILFPHVARAHQAKSPVPAYGCDGAPADAVLALPVPAGYWMRTVCTDKGHTLAPIPGDAWQIVQDSRPLAISVCCRAQKLHPGRSGGRRHRRVPLSKLAIECHDPLVETTPLRTLVLDQSPHPRPKTV